MVHIGVPEPSGGSMDRTIKAGDTIVLKMVVEAVYPSGRATLVYKKGGPANTAEKITVFHNTPSIVDVIPLPTPVKVGERVIFSSSLFVGQKGRVIGALADVLWVLLDNELRPTTVNRQAVERCDG